MSSALRRALRQRVLVVDDDREGREALVRALGAREIDAVAASSAEEALTRLREEKFGVVIADLELYGVMSGAFLCSEIAVRHPEALVVAMTAHPSMESATLAIRAGVHDFISKPIDIDELTITTESALKHASLREEVRRLRHTLSPAGDDAVFGESQPILRVLDLIARVAPTEAAVLVVGETGTGKEIVARAVHERSGRPGPFVAINCAAMTETLLEAELFGHVRGAFTDAHTTRAGLFVKAARGTLFLDEVGEMALEMQSKLLRALQERRVRPVGSDNEIDVDVRIVTATHRDLDDEVLEHRFREDLFYRINVVRIDVPPLRARGDDVLLLAQRFLERSATQNNRRVVGFTTRAAERLLAYSWPGNVRELQNCIERAVALAQFDTIGEADLPEKLVHPAKTELSLDPTELVTMDELEQKYTLRVLDLVHGNKSLASQILGFDRRTLHRRLRRWGVEPRSSAPLVAQPPADDGASEAATHDETHNGAHERPGLAHAGVRHADAPPPSVRAELGEAHARAPISVRSTSA
jgi:two-component system response regulator AtoC